MQNIASISLPEARSLALGSQLLLNNNSLTGKKGVLKVIEQLGYVQIDTISVVERSHRHILWTRVPDYKEDMLKELIDKDKKVFEYWSHAAAFLPMQDYRFAHYRKRMFTHYNKGWGAWAGKNKKVIKLVYDRVKAEGPLQSRDFEHLKKRGTWWDWKPAKHALEYLFHTGELMLRSRKNFQKIYDLRERILSPDINTTEPTDEEHAEHLIFSAVKQHGLVTKNEIVYQKFYSPPALKIVLKKLIDENLVVPVKVENLKLEYYTTETTLNKLNVLLPAPRLRQAGNEPNELIHILSPFDNFMIQRKRINSLFGFDYVIECYVPASKRKYGYYCLPVLYGDKFIGRIDAKADRVNDTLTVINLFSEKGIKKSELKKRVKPKLIELANFSGCRKVKFS